jgi:hypothetical protein
LFVYLKALYDIALHISLTTMAVKKDFPKRKTNGCTSFNFILCGEHYKIVEARRQKHYEETRGKVILGSGG